MGWCPRKRRCQRVLSPPSGNTRRWAAICKPGRASSPEPNHAATLILDFQLPKLGGNKHPLLKPPELWCLSWQPRQTNRQEEHKPAIVNYLLLLSTSLALRIPGSISLSLNGISRQSFLLWFSSEWLGFCHELCPRSSRRE